MSFELYWLPERASVDESLARIADIDTTFDDAFSELRKVASSRLNFLGITKIDRLAQSLFGRSPEEAASLPRVKLGILSSNTVDHLLASIRVGGLRRGLVIDTYVAPYGQYVQEVLNANSGLHAFAPDVVLMSVDSEAIMPPLSLVADTTEVSDAIDARIAEFSELWRRISREIGAIVVQQSVVDRTVPLFGNYEHRVPASPSSLLSQFNRKLLETAADENVHLLNLDWWTHQLGVRNLVDTKLWHQAKQEISPVQSPVYGDLLARQLAAIRGLSAKCLVLDLDNTLWGGVIGDDGLDGIILGQGSALGEAFVSFQHYVKQLADRGIILAVSSKNDPEIARSVFIEHPEMILKLDDMAAFEATWSDKPQSVRNIAKQLNIGLDSVVFFDDNPVERALMRETLSSVAVPEVPEAVEQYCQCIADAGYFEAVAFTNDDVQRNRQYIANRKRETLQGESVDLDSFLRSLEMEIEVGSFDMRNLARIVQLVNKTNQFNLTTHRYTEADIRRLMTENTTETLYARLRDRFGDNGIISVVIARMNGTSDQPEMEIDTWLMSCRVLGRRVEDAVLKVLVDAARRRGALALRGSYKETPKNGLVREHYANLGFREAPVSPEEPGRTDWILDLNDFKPKHTELFQWIDADERN